MIRVGVIHLKDYEKWIKQQGYDREWIIQSTQAELYRTIVEETANINAFSMPLTYDIFITILNSVNVRDFANIIDKIEHKISIKFDVYLGVGRDYIKAINTAKPMNIVNDDSDTQFDETVVVHFDLNNYNDIKTIHGFYYTLELVYDVLNFIRKSASGYGGIIYYAGGDNVINFIPSYHLDNFIKSIDEILKQLKISVKIGIGIALKPRHALKLAAQALDDIRLGRSVNRICIRKENE